MSSSGLNDGMERVSMRLSPTTTQEPSFESSTGLLAAQ